MKWFTMLWIFWANTCHRLLAVLPRVTQYTYNKDKQLTKVIRPDAQTMIYNYGAASDRLLNIDTPQWRNSLLTCLGSIAVRHIR